ncbi:hypothetical protein [Paracoccus actinidiae]|jgi:hypothetical protein|uniref:hypothetical protein n=1 Tax=Paracoccus actinidiae TaxID=3064531 RepID=UPI0027D22053|nr:hypothetical protein [Paracoccus sp. M09]
MKQRVIAISLALMPAMAMASSEDAWEEFRDKVETECLALVDVPESTSVSVEVNPFGSETYGAALVTAAYAGGTERMICIFHKQTGLAEITAPFTDAAPVE